MSAPTAAPSALRAAAAARARTATATAATAPDAPGAPGAPGADSTTAPPRGHPASRAASSTPRASPAARARARRHRAVCSALAVTAAVLAVLALRTGDFPLSTAEVLRGLAGRGPGATVVLAWRVPRVLAALLFGAALAASGAVFQSLTRNPLGSPDVIGLGTGSYTGALVVLTVLGGATGAGGAGTAVGALVGGLGTAALVYLLAHRRGVDGLRLVVVGIAVGAALQSVNTWLLLRASTEVAMAATVWGAGSLSLVGWSDVVPALVGVGVLAALLAALAPALRQLELGDDAAAAHGLRVERTRLALLVVGVGLTAVVTAAAGPVAFVALAAPQVAARLVRGAGLPLAASALVGAVLLLAADLVAQHALAQPLPVGVVTVVVGGGYLVVLLVAAARRAA